MRQARSGAPRGPFCGMGVCFDCLVTVDGRPSQRACLTKVEAGMDVRSSPAATALPGRERPRPAEEIACDVLVVGAGPAGLVAAARSLALAGASVVVLDERLHPGGQYFKPLAPSYEADDVNARSPVPRWGRAAAVDVGRPACAIVNEATVWAAFSAHEIAAVVAGQATLLPSQAAGAGDGRLRTVAPTIPGWTLPGVMTVGGLQTLARSYRVAPGQRIVIAGNGPLCLQTAAELIDGGANVVAVLEAAAASRSGAVAARWRVRRWPIPSSIDRRRAPRRATRRQLLHWDRRAARLVGEDRVRGIEAGAFAIDADIVALNYGFASSVGTGPLAGLCPSLRAARQRARWRR